MMMPPPTQIIAAVPAMLRKVRKPGMPNTSARPSARLNAPIIDAR